MNGCRRIGIAIAIWLVSSWVSGWSADSPSGEPRPMRGRAEMERTFGHAPIRLSPCRDGAVAWQFHADFEPDKESQPHFLRPFVFLCAPTAAYRVEIVSASYVSRDAQGKVLGATAITQPGALAALSPAVVKAETSQLHGARLFKLTLDRKEMTRSTLNREGEVSRTFTDLAGRIVFEGTPETSPGLTAPDDPFEPMLAAIASNYADSREWRQRPRFQRAAFDFARMHLADAPYLRIAAARRGPVRLALAELHAAGLPPGTRRGALALWRRGRQVPLLSLPGEGDALYFFNPGQPPPTSRNELFLLTWNGDNTLAPAPYALADAPADATPYPFVVSEHFEEDKNYYNETVGGYEGTWYWRSFGPGEAPFFWHNWTAENLARPGATAEMSARIYLVQRPPTRFEAKLNGHELETSRGETGRKAAPVKWRFPADWLTTSRQTLEIALEPVEQKQGAPVELDWFDLTYPQATRPVDNRLSLSAPAGVSPLLEATGFTCPRVALMVVDCSGHAALTSVETAALRRTRLPGPTWGGERNQWYFFVAGAAQPPATVILRPALDWTRDRSHADLVVLCADEFRAEAQRLVDYRARQGHAIRVFTREALYDAFNYGLPAVHPLKDAFAWAMADWDAPLPAYGLLIGDAAFDWKDDFGSGVRNYMPIYNPPAYPLTNSSDQWLSYLCGNDSIPDLVVSRLSCASRDDLAVMIDNVIAYETSAPLGPWRIRALMVGDDEGFGLMGRQIADRRVCSAAAVRVLDQSLYPYTRFPNVINGWLQRQALSVRDRIVDEMNRGVVSLNWYGHAAPHVWSHERVFKATEQPDNDMRMVHAGGKLAFVTNFSCRSGWINLVERPFNICLAEDLMRHPGKGAIGVLAPSGATGTSYHDQISDRLMELLFQRRNRVLGPLVTQTKIEYHLESENPTAIEVSDQFILVGDPLVQLALPEHDTAISCTPDGFTIGRAQSLRVQVSHPRIAEGTASLLAVLDPMLPTWEQVGEPLVDGQATFDLPVPATQTTPIRLYAYLCNDRTRQESMGLSVLHPTRGEWTWELVWKDGRAMLYAEPPEGTATARVALWINGFQQPAGELALPLKVDDATPARLVVEARNAGHSLARWEATLLPLGTPGGGLLVAPVEVSPNPLSALDLRATAETSVQNLSGRRLEGLRVRWLAAGQSVGEESVSLAPGEEKRLQRPLRAPFPPGELAVKVELIVP